VSDTGVVVTLSPGDYDAVLFDLDGVLARTASQRGRKWIGSTCAAKNTGLHRSGSQ
jgi:hypothetical protein